MAVPSGSMRKWVLAAAAGGTLTTGGTYLGLYLLGFGRGVGRGIAPGSPATDMMSYAWTRSKFTFNYQILLLLDQLVLK
jgi:hypothetical protein